MVIVKSCQNMRSLKLGRIFSFFCYFVLLFIVRNWFANNKFEHDVSFWRFVRLRKDQFLTKRSYTPWFRHLPLCDGAKRLNRRRTEWLFVELNEGKSHFWQSRTCVSQWHSCAVNGIGHITIQRSTKLTVFYASLPQANKILHNFIFQRSIANVFVRYLRAVCIV